MNYQFNYNKNQWEYIKPKIFILGEGDDRIYCKTKPYKDFQDNILPRLELEQKIKETRNRMKYCQDTNQEIDEVDRINLQVYLQQYYSMS